MRHPKRWTNHKYAHVCVIRGRVAIMWGPVPLIVIKAVRRDRRLSGHLRKRNIFCNKLRNMELQYETYRAYICKSKLWRDLMNNMFLYFAYGSNMNPARMAKRCPGAIALGGAVLLNHRLAERLYADIDFVSGATVEGVLYLISEANLARLDSFEGYPKVYRRLWLEVEFDGGIYQAITYEMSR